MDSLDELLKDTMDLHARQATAPQLPARISRRLRRNSRLRAAGVTLVTAGALTVGLWGAAALRGGTVASQPAALATTGECAGLTIVIGKPNPGEGSRRSPLEPVALRPGDNTIIMGRQDYRWLQASGPCQDRLIIEAPGPVVGVAYVDAAHQADGAAAKKAPFDRAGSVSVATIFTNTTTDATGQFTVRLTGTCDPGPCPPAATVQVTAKGSGTPAGQLATTTALP